jgi:hypothetical protein
MESAPGRLPNDTIHMEVVGVLVTKIPEGGVTLAA